MAGKFAESILDSMVDGNGHCGEKGLSEKQFTILAACLESSDCEYAGCWEGDFKTIDFWRRGLEGNIGKYHVVLSHVAHFHDRYSVVSIDPRPEEEVEEERRLEALADFSRSEWQHSPKDRVELDLTLVREYSYDRPAYAYGTETAYIYTFADDNGNCYVWKTTGILRIESMDQDGVWETEIAKVGDRVSMRATIKEHSEYRGTRQTVITRPKVKGLRR